MIDYDHAANLHLEAGPRIVMNVLQAQLKPRSILDVGCGTGTWLKAADELGISDTLGIDGVAIAPDRLLFSASKFRQVDLTGSWSLDRRFDLALCLEVAEHLDESVASRLVKSLTQHADRIVFSAACPFQPGQHHVNGQWPAYWQRLFNREGYSCDGSIRYQLWDNASVDPWYRQNMFIAEKNPDVAGHEARLHAYVHPEMLLLMFQDKKGLYWQTILEQVTQGRESISFYLLLPFRAAFGKMGRLLRRRSQQRQK